MTFLTAQLKNNATRHELIISAFLFNLQLQFDVQLIVLSGPLNNGFIMSPASQLASEPEAID